MKKNKKQTKPESLPKPVIAGDNRETGSAFVKEKILIWIFSVLSALSVYFIFALLIHKYYKPDINLLKSIGDRLLIGSNIVRPEPVEALLFRVAVMVIPLCFLGFYFFFSRTAWLKKIVKNPAFALITILCIALIIAQIYFDLAAPNPFGAGNGDYPQTPRDDKCHSNFDFYFSDLFLGRHLLLYTFVIVPLISCLYFFGFKKYNLERSNLFTLLTAITGYTLFGTTILTIVLMSTFNFPYQSENKYDFSAVYYSMTQVYAGLPMLVDHFTNTYGLYPLFLNPLFQLTSLSIFKFSLVMAMLIAISFMLNFYCLRQFVSNQLILFLGAFSMIFLPFLDFKIVENYDSVFSFFPIRYIVPSVLIYLATQYLRKKSNTIYWTTSVIMALFVLWNPEFGMLCYLSWILFNTYLDFHDETGGLNAKKIAIHWGAGAAVLVLVFILFKLWIYLFYGMAPDMSLLWSTIFIFSKLGFGLLPMTLLHPWNIVALILILGILFSIGGWLKKKAPAKAAIVFLVTIVGVGFLFYFQGRSHNWSLATSSGISMFLLTILGDELWMEIKNRDIFFLNALFVIFLYVISFSVFETISGAGKLFELVYQEKDIKSDEVLTNGIETGKEYIANNTEAGQKIYLLTIRKYQALYFDNTKLRSAFNPGMIDLFLNSDLERLENRLIDSANSIFITPYTFQGLKFMARPLAAVAATYEFNKGIDIMTLLEKRKTKIPGHVFFDSTASQVFHRKYTGDKKGTETRISDAFGTKPIILDSEFSIQILFNSKKQIFTMGTLIGNRNEYGGFSLGIPLNASKCILTVNNITNTFPIPDSGWVYCAMNMHKNHCEVYINGKRSFSQILSEAIKNAPDNLCVGNLGYMHYYVGAISEVAIANRTIDSSTIAKTWQDMSTALQY